MNIIMNKAHNHEEKRRKISNQVHHRDHIHPNLNLNLNTDIVK